ncbi:MAG: hypothetical protein DI543_16245 [Bradyrhizobium icense]|nr:MAG: hypothetical protein DI543_16245 [Bradyrhizobium icense]
MPLDPDVAGFVDLLRRIEALLVVSDARYWAGQIAACRQIAEKSDGYGVIRFLSLFGGMGSLNDVVLTRGGKILESENDVFSGLLSEAHGLAQALARDAGL